MSIEEISDTEQVSIFKDQLKKKYPEDDILRISNTILESLRVVNCSSLLGNPLNVCLVAKELCKNRKLYEETIEKNIFTSTKFLEILYNGYVDYYYGSNMATTRLFSKVHFAQYQCFALKTFLGNDLFKTLGLEENCDFLEDLKVNRDRLGIIQIDKNGKVLFTYPHFAMYAASIWFRDNLHHLTERIFNKILENRDLVPIMDSVLCENSSPHLAIIYNKYLNLEHNIESAEDLIGRNLLHLAFYLVRKDVIRPLLDQIDIYAFDMFKNTPIFYAELFENLTLQTLLIDKICDKAEGNLQPQSIQSFAEQQVSSEFVLERSFEKTIRHRRRRRYRRRPKKPVGGKRVKKNLLKKRRKKILEKWQIDLLLPPNYPNKICNLSR